MEEKENKSKKVTSWLKKNWAVIVLTGISLLEGYCMIKENVDLGKEKRRLEGENADLKGQIHACEKENRHLARELGNVNYQFGKLVASTNKK